MPGANAAARRAYGLRNRVGGSFDKLCEIQTPTLVDNGAGGEMEGAPKVEKDVPCEVRFPKSSPRETTGDAIVTTLARVEIRLPVGTEVSVSSRIYVEGRAYDVQEHDTGRSFASEIVCDCLRSGDAGQPPSADSTPD